MSRAMEMNAVEIDLEFEVDEILDGILYFKGTESELEADSWKKSQKSLSGYIENHFKQCLEARPDDPEGCCAVFVIPGPDQQRFDLQFYRTDSISEGLSVAFAVKCKNEKYFMCLSNDMKLYFKKGNPPDSIEGDSSDIIFFQTQFSEGQSSFKFQSSKRPGYYLAFSDQGEKRILTLKKPYDELDETQQLNVTS